VGDTGWCAKDSWTIRELAETLVSAANNGVDPQAPMAVAIDDKEFDMLGVWFEKGKVVVRALGQGE